MTTSNAIGYVLGAIVLLIAVLFALFPLVGALYIFREARRQNEPALRRTTSAVVYAFGHIVWILGLILSEVARNVSLTQLLLLAGLPLLLPLFWHRRRPVKRAVNWGLYALGCF